jgi:ABC-2 type transport system permease protein
LVLLAGALAAIGLAVSALTSSQIVAAVVSLGLFGILWAIDAWAALLPAPIDNWVLGLSLLARFTPFAAGAMYASDLGFFLTVTLFGLLLAVRALARR